MSVCVIVLNWQGWKDTLACLDSLSKLHPIKPTTIIVCDNGSQDNSVQRIFKWAQQNYIPVNTLKNELSLERTLEWNSNDNSHIPGFVIIQTGANRGFSGGNNFGIRYALKKQYYEYLWLLNNDTVVHPEALLYLYKYGYANPKIALIGSTVINYENNDIVQCAGGCYYFPIFTIFKNALGGKKLSLVMQSSEKIKLDYIYGASMFIRASVVNQVGLLNEDYFLFYEELDYTKRLQRQGYEIGWCKKSLVYHKGGASVGNKKNGNAQKAKQANYYENLSTFKYTARFYPQWLFLVIPIRIALKSLAFLLRGDFFLFSSLFKAYLDFQRSYHENHRSS